MNNSKPKILIVDNDSIASMALEALLSSEPYDLYFASNGLDGIATATTLHPTARLFALVDVWDALCSDRPYRSAMPKADVLDYIRIQAGTHFDPSLTKIFIDLISDKA